MGLGAKSNEMTPKTKKENTGNGSHISDSGKQHGGGGRTFDAPKQETSTIISNAISNVQKYAAEQSADSAAKTKAETSTANTGGASSSSDDTKAPAWLSTGSSNTSSGNSSGGSTSGGSSGSGSRSRSYGGGSGISQAVVDQAVKDYTEAAAPVKTPTYIYTPGAAQKLSGYIQDGKAYLSDGTRIGDGYTVVTDGGKLFTMKDGKGYETTLDALVRGGINSGIEEYKNNYATNAYDEALKEWQERQNSILKQQQAAIDASVQQGVNALNKQKGTLGETYDQAARDAYIAYMQAQKGLNEQYAAAGISGGATESGRIALENNYSNNVTDISKQRASSLADIDSAITDARLTGDIQKAQSAAQIAQGAAEKYLELAQNRIALEREVMKEAESEEERKLQYYLTYIDAYADNPQAEIDKLLNQGVSETDPRILALKALITQERKEAEALAREEELARIKASARGSYSGNGGNTGATQSAGSTSGTTSSSGWNPLSKLEDKATVKTFMNLHQGSYNKADIETDYKNGFLTDEAYKLLKQSLTDANAKAAVNTYWKEGFNQ